MKLDSLIHGALLRLPPETAHDLGLALLRIMPPLSFVSDENVKVKTRFGILNNPVGLAGGFDKTGKCIRQLEKLGFGYLVVGTVTRDARKGNKRPRILRRPDEFSLVNAMGFPNPGIKQFLKNVKHNKPRSTPTVISISDEKIENLIECYKMAQEVAWAIEINISSPNTPALRHYFQLEVFNDLVQRIKERRIIPTYLKLPPMTSSEEKSRIIDLAKAWWEAGLDGVTVVNTLPVIEPKLSTGTGGMSGRPLFSYMLNSVKTVYVLTDGELEINAVGGIFSGKDALLAIMNGATTVQLYTALVYRGPRIVAKILEELLIELKKNGLSSVEEARGIVLRQQ